MIPLSEVQQENENPVRMIVSNVSYSQDYFTLSRLFVKHVHPLRSYFTGFLDSYEIDTKGQ